MLVFESPSGLNLEGLSAWGSFLASSASSLGGNEWMGELRVFELVDDRLSTCGAVRLQVGSCCNALRLDHQLVVCGCDDGQLLGFRMQGDEQTLNPTPHLNVNVHDDLVSCLTLSCSVGVTGGWDAKVVVSDLVKGQSTSTIPLQGPVSGVQLLGESMLAVGERSGRLSLWDMRDQSLIQEHLLEVSVTSLCISDDTFVLAGCGNGSVYEWNPRDELVHIQQVRKHHAPVHALAVDGETQRLLSGSDDGVVFGIGKQHTDFVRGAAWLCKRPITASWDGTIRFMDQD